MAFTVAQISQTKRDAFDNEGIAILSRNELIDNVLTPPFFNTTGTTAATDLSSTTYPADLMRDNRMTAGARSTGSSSTWYVNAALNSAATVNCVIVAFSNMVTNSVDLTVTAGNVADFSSGSGTIWTQTITTGAQSTRVVVAGLNHVEGGHTSQDREYQNLEWIRLQFDMGSVTSAPNITEFWVGEMLQFSNNYIGGATDEPRGMDTRETPTAARGAFRYERAAGFADPNFTFQFVGYNQDRYGMDDRTTFESFRTQTVFGTRPFWIRSREGNWHLCQMNQAPNSYLPRGEYLLQDVDFQASELPPFAAREAL